MTIKIYFTLLIIFSSLCLFAQPAPPTTPYGSPVPVGELSTLVFLVGIIWFSKRKNNKR